MFQKYIFVGKCLRTDDEDKIQESEKAQKDIEFIKDAIIQ